MGFFINKIDGLDTLLCISVAFHNLLNNYQIVSASMAISHTLHTAKPDIRAPSTDLKPIHPLKSSSALATVPISVSSATTTSSSYRLFNQPNH